MANLTKEDIANKLRGIERYNPLHIDILTEYLNEQCKNNFYDHEANSAILKLYQFNPSQFKTEIVEKILLKALTNLPHPDFVLCELLIESSKITDGIQNIIELHQKLELCQFKAFWDSLSAHEELVKEIKGFKEGVRKFVIYVIGITYQNVRTSQLKDFLNLKDDTEFNNALTENGWKVSDDGYVTIASQEDTIKTINITEKIELEQVVNILATYR